MRNGIDAYVYASLAKTSASVQKTCRCTSARMDASTDIFSSRLATSGITRQGLIHWSAWCVVQRKRNKRRRTRSEQSKSEKPSKKKAPGSANASAPFMRRNHLAKCGDDGDHGVDDDDDDDDGDDYGGGGDDGDDDDSDDGVDEGIKVSMKRRRR